MSAPPPALVQKILDALENAADAMWDQAYDIGLPVFVKRHGNGHYANPVGALELFLTSIYRDLRMLAEVTEQSECLADIKRYDAAQSGQYGSVNFDAEYDHVYATGLDEARRFLDSLLAATDYPSVSTGETAFENILLATAKILHEENVTPACEKQVRDPVFKVLKYAFPDVTRVGTIPHPGKTYIPDFTSKSAESAAEYKFVTDSAALANAYDDISADMKGYGGDPTIRFKYAVIYLASPFASQADADAHFKSVGKPADWKIIVLNGASGKRNRPDIVS